MQKRIWIDSLTVRRAKAKSGLIHWQFEEQRRSIPAWFRESLSTSALSDFRNTWLGGNTNGFFLTENVLWNKTTGPVWHVKCLEMFRGKGSAQRSHISKTRRNLTSFTLSALVLEENLQNSVKQIYRCVKWSWKYYTFISSPKNNKYSINKHTKDKECVQMCDWRLLYFWAGLRSGSHLPETLATTKCCCIYIYIYIYIYMGDLWWCIWYEHMVNKTFIYDLRSLTWPEIKVRESRKTNVNKCA